MLTERLIASIGVPVKPPGTNIAKDAAIFIHEFQPTAAQRTVYKKSATLPDCLAVSETHIFAAQSEKAVVHVYNREKGNQESTVPFPERITALALACQDTVLILGTTDGRVIAWEIASGRLVSTAQSHLQAVTALAVDVTSNFLLSSSKDSTVHVWSIPELLAFSSTNGSSPLRTFTTHRAEVSTLAIGHSASNCNFAVSASIDKTCLIWDFRTNSVLRTYLLPSVPTCLTLDAADRALYLGYDDGSVQQIDLYHGSNKSIDAVQNGTNAANPIQPAASTRWKLPDLSHGVALSMSLSFDSTTLVTGHESGIILTWDVNRKSYLSNLPHTPLPGPVTNLQFLPVSGFESQSSSDDSNIRIVEITKPKFGAFSANEDGSVPGNYTLNVQFPSELLDEGRSSSAFREALFARSFPASLLDQGLSELMTWGTFASAHANKPHDEGADFITFEDQPEKVSLKDENAALKLQIEALQRVQMKSLQSIQRLSDEKKVLVAREEKRLAKRTAVHDGTEEVTSDLEMSDSDESG